MGYFQLGCRLEGRNMRRKCRFCPWTRGLSRSDSGQNDRPNAINTLQIAVLLGSEHAEAHFDLAIAYEGSNRLREALQEITASLRLTPKDSDEHNTKAIICAELGDFVCARAEWEYLAQAAPDYAPARANLTSLNGSAMRPPASTSIAPDRFPGVR
jgi:Flp pilus assembly protein TadD